MINQSMELIAVFVQHSYEKVSVVKYGCLIEQFFAVFFALNYTMLVHAIILAFSHFYNVSFKCSKR